MAKLQKAKPSAKAPRVKPSILKKYGHHVKEAFQKAKDGIIQKLHVEAEHNSKTEHLGPVVQHRPSQTNPLSSADLGEEHIVPNHQVEQPLEEAAQHSEVEQKITSGESYATESSPVNEITPSSDAIHPPPDCSTLGDPAAQANVTHVESNISAHLLHSPDNDDIEARESGIEDRPSQSASPSSSLQDKNEYLYDADAQSKQNLLRSMACSKRQSAPAAIWVGLQHSSSETLLGSGTQSGTHSPASTRSPAAQAETAKPNVTTEASVQNPMFYSTPSAEAKFMSVDEHALMISKAVKDAEEACNQGWEAAFEVKESNHRVALEEAADDHQADMDDLKAEHEESVKKVKRQHAKELARLRAEMKKVKVDNEAKENTTKDLGERNDCLVGHIQRLTAEKDQKLEIAPSTSPSGLEGVVDDPTNIAWQLSQTQKELAEALEQIDIAERQGWSYQQNLYALLGDLEQDPAKTAKVDGLLKIKDDVISELREDISKHPEEIEQYSNALELEKCKREVESADFADQVALVTKDTRLSQANVRKCDNDVRQLREENELLVQKLSANITLNEYDNHFANLFNNVKKDNDELRLDIQGLNNTVQEQQAELNIFREKDRRGRYIFTDLEISTHTTVAELESQLEAIKHEKETLQIELEIAQYDANNREPEPWRVVREEVLHKKNQEIAELRAQLEQ